MAWQRKRKYNNQPSGGFDSQAEKRYGEVLEMMVRGGLIKSYVHHPPAIELMPAPRIAWKVDFKVMALDGSEFWVEYKGMKTRDYSLKLRIWKNQVNDGTRDDVLFVVQEYAHHKCKVIDSVNVGTIPQPI